MVLVFNSEEVFPSLGIYTVDYHIIQVVLCSPHRVPCIHVKLQTQTYSYKTFLKHLKRRKLLHENT